MSLSGRLKISIEAVNRTREEFQEVENGIERLRKARLAASRVVLEEQRTQRFLTQAYKAQHQQFMDSISVMRSVGYIGRSLLTMWQAYTIGQIHVAESLNRVEDAQIAVTTALDLYGESSVVYQDAVSDLEDLELAAKRAKGNATAGLIGLGLTAVGVAAQVATLASKLGLISELAIAGGIALPIVITWALKEFGKDLPGYEEGDPSLPPGPANAPGINLGALLGDIFGGEGGQGFGGGGGGVRDGISVVQINYGVEGAQDSLQSLEDLLNNLFVDEEG